MGVSLDSSASGGKESQVLETGCAGSGTPGLVLPLRRGDLGGRRVPVVRVREEMDKDGGGQVQRKQFTFYRSFYEAILKISESKRWLVMEALIRFALDKEEPKGLDDEQMMYFILVKPTLETAWRKAWAGSIGKRGPAQKNNKGEKEEENEIEKENENEIETETETEGFRAFWERYPVKLGRAAARKAWECVCLNEREILSGVEDWILSKQWALEGGRYIPKPEKFLKEAWWQQKPAGVGVPKGASGRLGSAELEAIEQLFQEEP